MTKTIKVWAVIDKKKRLIKDIFRTRKLAQEYKGNNYCISGKVVSCKIILNLNDK